MKHFYSHIMSSAGFSGENWDVSEGHNLSFDSSGDANDVTLVAVGKTITLASGSFPSWMQEVGKVFSTDSGTNPGPFTIVSATASVVTVAETVIDEAGVDMVFDGSPDIDIQDVLLKTGDGILTQHCPLVLTSIGALGAARTLDISALEVESGAYGSKALDGRWFYISIQNSDISSTNKITVSGSTSINGLASLDIETTGDYLFHHVSGGVWRCNILPTPAEHMATMARVSFADTDWSAGTKNQIKVIQTGSPGSGEVGPHGLTAYDSYIIQIVNVDGSINEITDNEVQIDSNGDITILKAGLGSSFNGYCLIVGTLD